jgi:hypothetical protein
MWTGGIAMSVCRDGLVGVFGGGSRHEGRAVRSLGLASTIEGLMVAPYGRSGEYPDGTRPYDCVELSL